MLSRVLPLALIFLSTSLLAEDNWPEFRGPKGDGHSDATGLPVTFGEGDHVKWKTAIHGKGWSSPVIWGSQVWLTTATDDGTELSVLCIDKESGKVLRDDVLFRVATPQFCHKFNSYASPTPAIEEGRVYVTFGSPGTACLDTKTGQKIWERTDFVCNHYRGAGSSPILWQDLVIMNFDGSDHQFIVALDKKTGKTVWETQRSADYGDLAPDGTVKNEGDYRKAFGTCHVYVQDGRSVLLSSGAKAHYAYDPASGKELWRFADPDHHSAAARPLVGFGMEFISAGFGKGAIYAVNLGGSGLLDPAKSLVWEIKKAAPSKPSLLLIDDLLYLFNDGGIVSCAEAKTGNVLWSERLGGNCSASPIFADGRIYMGNEENKMFVLAPGREFKVLAENKFTDGFMSSPAVSGKALYLRTRTNLYRVEN
ncbi:MAG: PQQ-binding-like beta-propeller repeat protein [Chthoniobacteraceae bacterium]